MGHLVFLVLHFGLLLFMPIALILTIPLHLIYGAVMRPVERGPSSDTHVKCSDCKELVLRDATVCKHCGCKLTPIPRPRHWLVRVLDPNDSGP